jgi:hypothetical protein
MSGSTPGSLLFNISTAFTKKKRKKVAKKEKKKAATAAALSDFQLLSIGPTIGIDVRRLLADAGVSTFVK